MFLDELEMAARAGEQTVRQQPEWRGFELPGGLWAAMFACYALFFGGLTVATGRAADSVFVLVIAIGFAVMFFGTAAVMVRIAAKHAGGSDPRKSGGWTLDTLGGPMSSGEAAVQILSVPVMLAAFGVSIAVIRALLL